MIGIILMIIFICLTMADEVNNVIISGSDVQLSYGVVYAIQSVSSGRYLDGRAGEPNPLMKDTDNLRDRFIHWTIKESNNGYVLKSVSSGNYLDGRAGEPNPLMKNTDNLRDRHIQFVFEAVGKYNDVYPRVVIKSVSSGNYLDGRAGEPNPSMKNTDNLSDRFIQWVFVPVDYKLKAVLSDFDFGNFNDIEEQLNSEKTLAFIESKTIVAKEVGLTVEGAFSRSIEESFTFGFEQTVGVGVETEISAGVPLLAKASTTVTASFEFSANQQKTMTRTSEYSQSYSFEPKETGVYEVGILVYEDTDARLPFTSTVYIYGTSNDGTKIYTGQELLGIIYYDEFNCEVVDFDDELVEAKIEGTLKASYAVSSEIYNERVGDIPEEDK